MTSPWPFLQWGIDIVGPFSKSLRKLKFLIVTEDYFTKWVEDEVLAVITYVKVTKFVWRQIVCLYGLPHTILSNNGKQFMDNPFKKRCIKQNFSSVAHPQANGQVEVTNRTMDPTKEIPFNLVYGTKVVVLIKVSIQTLRTSNPYANQRVSLDQLEERHNNTSIQQTTYKVMVERYYNKQVKGRYWAVGDVVLIRNEASKQEHIRRLSPNCEDP
uniref:Integrase catalytic domain-containing protein n=1 Tax=Lactuca sativa TaxID=4236 RepID=A0A9R1WCU1_LACSA|nr:hypothetical protein LSAT_V11C200069710 [Lactuca sativa]